MSKPPKIVIPGLNRGSGIPPGYVVGRARGTGKGPAQLIKEAGLRTIGIATVFGVTTSTSDAISRAHSEVVSLSTGVSSSLSGAVSGTASLSTAVSTALSSTNSTNVTQSTSLSQISSSLSGAISSTTSLSTAVSTVDSGQAASLSTIQTAGGSIKLPVTIVASLPAASTEGAGAIRAVSDALTPALGVAVVGGGGVYVIVLSDGTNWIAN